MMMWGRRRWGGGGGGEGVGADSENFPPPRFVYSNSETTTLKSGRGKKLRSSFRLLPQ